MYSVFENLVCFENLVFNFFFFPFLALCAEDLRPKLGERT